MILLVIISLLLLTIGIFSTKYWLDYYEAPTNQKQPHWLVKCSIYGTLGIFLGIGGLAFSILTLINL